MSFVYPDYRSRSIYTLANSIARKLRIDADVSTRVLGEVEDTDLPLSLVLVDGLGWEMCEAYGLDISSAERFTTVFPSTTSNVLATLFSARYPSEHGIIGYTLYSKRLGVVVNTLEYTAAQGFGRDMLAKVEPMASMFYFRSTVKSACDMGKRVLIIQPSNIWQSEYSRMLYGTAEIQTYKTVFDAFQVYRNALEKGYDFVHLYIPYVDQMAHAYGPSSDPTVESARYIFSRVLSVFEQFRGRWRFLLTADHGHIELSERVVMNDNQDLMGLLNCPPYGDPRAVMIRGGQDAARYFEERYGNMQVFAKNSEELKGLMGPSKGPRLDDVMPDFIAVPTDNRGYFYNFRNSNPPTMVGSHSGLSASEMYIPLLIL
ncbi:nucleotide pyrophosphatase [Thermogymnomonas acidicola]|uniref:Nucleotide pyrophosphatase n=1 Tax=Thermogymnomonas acidicola TaxID=399579 RepID=A0AA37F9T9_9ARCH|nr:alkaline phosphatase family protein [Thermogymnomonas acidicola]GGM77078.1 nucleotide pyrophosphatase [Thermogymnomonas acidicola]